MEDAIGDLDFVTRSTTRVRLLAALYERDRLEKREIRERVEASRTTVQRNLDALIDRGWIASDNREYWLTQVGEPVVERLLELTDTIYVAREFEPLLQWVPADQFDLDVHSLATAEITVATQSDPYAPINRHVDLLRRAETFRCLLPAVGLQPLLVARDRVLDDGSAHQVVVDESVAATLRSDRNYLDPLSDLLGCDRFTLMVTERSIPFYLGIGGETVQIGVSDDTGSPHALVESTAAPVLEWANRKFRTYRASARTVRSPSLEPEIA